MMNLMAEKKQGCIRFKWGRDWNVRDFSTMEEAKSLKGVPYKMYLGNKTNLLKGMLQKDKQVSFMDKIVQQAQQKRMTNEAKLKANIHSDTKRSETDPKALVPQPDSIDIT